MPDSVFDTVSGLPVHILVVHAAVVLIPLVFLVTLAFVVRPQWRPGLSWAVLGNLVAVASAYAAMESGEKLQGRLSAQAGGPIAEDHGELGASLVWFAVAMLVASLLAWLLLRRSVKPWPSAQAWDTTHRGRGASSVTVVVAALLVLGTGAAGTYWTVRVGDSGSRAAWEDTIANTQPPAGG